MGTQSKVTPPRTLPAVVVAVVMWLFTAGEMVTAVSWCVVRSEASQEVLQTSLDYACGAGADCAPIQQSGLCFLPNTIQAHASYAFNSYYQRKAMAPGSCDFSGTATVASTNPSYGSCVYPSSQSTAGGTVTPGGGMTTPITTPISAMSPPPPSFIASPLDGGGGLTPIGGVGSSYAAPPISKAFAELFFSRSVFRGLVSFVLLLWF